MELWFVETLYRYKVLVNGIFSIRDKLYLKVVKLAVGAGRNVEGGDVEDDLLAVSGEDPPLALVPLLEGLLVSPRGRGVERGVLGGAELG